MLGFVIVFVLINKVLSYGWSQTSLSSGYWTSIAVSNQSQYVLATNGYVSPGKSLCNVESGQVLLSSNSGTDWTMVTSLNTGYSGAAISGTGEYMYYQSTSCNGSSYTADFKYYVSSDFGYTWTKIDACGSSYYNSYITEYYNAPVAVSSSGQYAWFVCTTGAAFTDDFGLTWVLLKTTDTYSSVGISGSGEYAVFTYWDSLTITICGNYSTSSCNDRYIDDYFFYGAALSFSGQYMYVVGNFKSTSLDVVVYASTDYGATFTALSYSGFSPSSVALYPTVSCSVTGGTVIVSGNLISTDYGESWSTVTSPDSYQPSYTAIAGNDASAFMIDNYDVYSYVWTMTDFGPPPTLKPSHQPTLHPTHLPTTQKPTALPTYHPTHVPTCGAGHTSVDGSCGNCSAGTYATAGQACTDCEYGTYSTDTDAQQCTSCSFPRSTRDLGSTASSDCTAFCICANAKINVVVFINALVFIVLGIFLEKSSRVAACLVLFFPAFDVLTDLAYLTNTRFYDPVLFLFVSLFFLSMVPFFVVRLWRYKAAPANPFSVRGFAFLGYSSTAKDSEAADADWIPFPTMYGKRFVILFSGSHHNLFMFLWEGMVWVVAILLQLLLILSYPVKVLLHITFLLLWLLLGFYLHMTKLMTIGTVWNLWIRWWTLSDSLQDELGFIDTADFNWFIVLHCIFQSVPNLVVQAINNFLLDEWSGLAILSAMGSGFMILSCVYRYSYWSFLVREPKPLVDIPVDYSIRIKLFALDFTVVNGAVKAHTKHLDGDDKKGREYSSEKSVTMNVLRPSSNSIPAVSATAPAAAPADAPEAEA